MTIVEKDIDYMNDQSDQVSEASVPQYVEGDGIGIDQIEYMRRDAEYRSLIKERNIADKLNLSEEEQQSLIKKVLSFTLPREEMAKHASSYFDERIDLDDSRVDDFHAQLFDDVFIHKVVSNEYDFVILPIEWLGYSDIESRGYEKKRSIDMPYNCGLFDLFYKLREGGGSYGKYISSVECYNYRGKQEVIVVKFQDDELNETMASSFTVFADEGVDNPELYPQKSYLSTATPKKTSYVTVVSIIVVLVLIIVGNYLEKGG